MGPKTALFFGAIETLERRALLKHARRRDAIRGLFGPRYAQAIGPARELLKVIMERDGVDVVAAFGDVCQQAVAGGNEVAVSMLACAAIDMLEEDL